MNPLRVIGLFFALILVSVLVGPLVIPLPPLGETVPAAELADPDSKFIEIGDLTVHYKEQGSGDPAIILLHGFGASEFSWREVMDPFSEVSRTVAYDRPAFGLTERPMPEEWTGESPYSPQEQVRLVIELMDALQVNHAVLVGNSAGGTIAVATALEYPERIQGLVLVDAAIYNAGGASKPLAFIMKLPQVDRLGPWFVRDIQNWGENMLTAAWANPDKITEEVREGFRRPLQVDNWDRALWEMTKVSSSLNLPERLSELAIPVLVITGDSDQIVPVEDSLRLGKDIPGAEVVVIDDCGHVPHEECPDEFLEAALPFLQSIMQ